MRLARKNSGRHHQCLRCEPEPHLYKTWISVCISDSILQFSTITTAFETHVSFSSEPEMGMGPRIVSEGKKLSKFSQFHAVGWHSNAFHFKKLKKGNVGNSDVFFFLNDCNTFTCLMRWRLWNRWNKSRPILLQCYQNETSAKRAVQHHRNNNFCVQYSHAHNCNGASNFTDRKMYCVYAKLLALFVLVVNNAI